MSRLTPRQRSLAFHSALAGCVLLVALVSLPLALTLVPPLALAAALFAGSFPGAELIDRLRERRAMPAARRRGDDDARLPAFPRAVAYVRPSGRAFSFALAMRPPPRATARA